MDRHQEPPRAQNPPKPPITYMTEEERRSWSGTAQWKDPLDTPPAAEEQSRLAMVSAALGALSLLLVCASYLSAGLGAAALICGIVSRVRSGEWRRLSAAGVVLGAISLAIALVLLILFLAKKILTPGIEGILPDMGE